MKRHVTIYLLTLTLLHSALSARTITVVSASESPQKVAVITAAFNEQFPHDTICYISHKTASQVPEQPVGIDAAMQGIHNRLNNLPEDALKQADYAVSIENYIEQSSTTQRWYDKGLVLLKNCSSSEEIVLATKATFIPTEYVQLAQQLSSEISEQGYSVTAGQAIQKSFPDRAIDPHDWHREVEFGGVSRQELLKDALYKALHAEELTFLKSLVAFHPDFPKPGILFADFFPLFNSSKSFQITIDLLAQRYKGKNIDAIVGLESRGFILGAALAYKLGIRFVPVRKPNKLPGAIHSVSYQKEYGSDILTISQSSLSPHERVVIIDDLIATGGSARAAIELVKLTHAKPIEFVTVLKVAVLEEQAQLTIPSFNLID